MSNVIWKHNLPNPLFGGCGYEAITIDMPDGALPLSVGDQHGELTMWILLDPMKPRFPRQFEVFGTGIAISDIPRRFVGTVQLGSYVWHVFEVLGQQSEEGTNERN